MFNTGFRGKRASDGTGIINPQENFVQNKYPVPTITSWSVSGSDDDALNPAGGQTVLVNGGGFFAGCAASVNGVTITPVTVISANQISFTSPALAGGSYTLIVYNSAGGGAILVPGLVYSSVPTYTTAAGSIGTGYETTALSTSVVATSDSSITYTVTSGALPSGASMTTSGVITGTYPTLSSGSSETFYFDITATDAEDQDVTRSFSLTTNIDVVTWVTPSSGATITLDGAAYSQALSATDAAGYAVSYTANALPTGLTLSSGTISGTPTTEQTVSTLLTATAATTNRSATNTITWVVSLADVFWKNVTLLLNGSTPTTTFINDASLNNSQLTIQSDTKPNNFNPYENGYYSVQFNGTVNDYVSIPTNTGLSIMSGSTNTFVAECWVNWNVVTANQCIMDKSGRNGVSFQNWSLQLDASKYIKLIWGASGSPGTSAIGAITTTTIPVAGQWYHIALVKSSADWSVFVNGTRGATFNGLNTANDANLGALRIGLGIDAEYNGVYMNGFVSNVRIYNGPAGSAPYSATSTTITVPTSPLTPVSTYTYAITNQSARYLDNSSVGATVTPGSGVKISSVYPFSTPTTSSYNNQYSTTFDGTGDYLTVASNAAFQFGTGDFTIETWIWPNDLSANNINNFINIGTYLTGIMMRTTSAGGVQLYFAGTSKIPVQAGLTAKSWNHVALVRIGTSCTLYIGGAVNYTFTDSTSLSPATATVTIGMAAHNSGEFFTGHISNMRIVKGTGIYTTTFTPSTSPLTTTSQGVTAGQVSLLTCQDSTLKDNSTNAFTITSAADARPVPVSPFTMTTSNTTVTSLGSVYFDGTGDYLSLNSSPAFALSGDYTIEAWVYRTDSGTQRAIIDLRGGSFLNVLFYMNSSNQLIVFNSTSSWITSTGTIPINQWAHVALTRSGTSAKLFINGVVAGTATNSDVNVSSGPPYIGRQNGSTTNDWLGYIADARVIKGTALYTSNFLPPQTTLTPVTNTQLLTCQYNGGATNNGFVDQSNFNNIITRNGNTTQGTFSPFSQTGWSNYFGGNDSYLASAGSSILPSTQNTFTLECWIYLTANAAAYSSPLVPGTFGDINGVTNYLSFGPVYSSGAGGNILTMYWYDGSGKACSGTGLISINRWTHLAISVSSNTIKIFIDGVSQTLTGTTTLTNRSGTSGAYSIGAYWYGNYSTTNGYISNLRVVSGTSLYNATFTPSTAPLAAVANTTLLACQSPSFVDNGPLQTTWTKNGTTSVQAFSPFGGVTSVPTSYSNYFDGSGDGLTTTATGATFGTGNFTIECWIYRTGAGTDENIFVQGVGGTSGYGLGLLTLKIRVRTPNIQDNSTLTGDIATRNTWHHVALVRNSGTTSLYFNGTSVLSFADTSNETATAWNIGHYGSNDYVLNGYISNLRVVTGTALYTSNFTPSTTPLTAVANTSLLSCQNATLIDNGTNKFTLTAAGNVKPTPFNPFGTTNTIGVSYTPIVNGGSTYFDGTGDYLQTATGLIHTDITQTDYTIECWVYNMGAGAERYIYSQRGASSGWEMRINAANTVSTFFTSGTTFTTTATVPANAWTHIAATRVGTTIRVFINGIQSATGTQSNGTSAYASYGLWLGNSTSAGGGLMLGYISDARVIRGQSLYNANFYPGSAPAIPTSTTTYLLNGTSGGIIDYHATNDLETVGNTQLAPEDPYAGSYYSNYFDGGSGSNLTVPAGAAFNMGTSDFSIEMWVNPISQSLYGCLLTFDAADYPLAIYYGSSVGGGNIMAAVGSTSAWFTNTTAMTFGTTVKGVWSHILMTRSGNDWRCFQDGVLRYYATQAGTVGDSSGNIYIGSNGSTPYATSAYISNVRIIKGSIPTSYQTSSTTTGTTIFTPSTSPLTTTSQGATSANVSLLTCQNNKFQDNSTNNFTVTRNGVSLVKSINPFQNNTGKSLYFNGTSNALLFPGSSVPSGAGSAFTFEFWIYPTTLSFVVLRCNGSASSFGISTNSSGQVILSNTFVADFLTATGGAVTINAWNHIAITRTSANLYTVYLNGNSVGSATYATALGEQPMYIGYNTYNSVYYNYYIKDLRVTKGVVRTITVPTGSFKTN